MSISNRLARRPVPPLILVLSTLWCCSCSSTLPRPQNAIGTVPSGAAFAGHGSAARQPASAGPWDRGLSPPSPTIQPVGYVEAAGLAESVAAATVSTPHVPRIRLPQEEMLPPPGAGPGAAPYGAAPQSRDEFLFDGGDRNLATEIGRDWSIRGLDTEDTIAHFDTLEGQRRVEASNRVEIYAPRFASVRKIYGIESDLSYGAAQRMEETSVIGAQLDSRGTIVAHTNLQPDNQIGSRYANVFRDRTRGLEVENPQPVTQFHNVFAAYENMSLMRYGVLENSDKARLAEGLAAAKVWEHHLPAQLVVENVEAVVARDVAAVQATLGLDLRESRPEIRVVKIASAAQAQPGDLIDFTIRFDNIGNEAIGNVTLLDNLTPRLEYVEGSAQCDLEFDFYTQENEAGSLLLRFEIIEPLDSGQGGVARFRCRVR